MYKEMLNSIVFLVIIVTCAVASSIVSRKFETFSGSFVMNNISKYCGDDNFTKSVDPNKTSCMYYVTERRGWKTLSDEDDGTTTQTMMSMQHARGLVPGNSPETPRPCFDACVIPKEALKSYNIDENCKLTTIDKELQLDKTKESMVLQGCMIDFSGQLGKTKKNEMTESEFKEFLKVAAEGMNYADELRKKKLRDEITSLTSTISIKDGKIGENDTSIARIDTAIKKASQDELKARGVIPAYTNPDSHGKWFIPVPDLELGTWEQMQIRSAGNMTFTFMLYIVYPNRSFRNIIHVTQKKAYGPYQARYNFQEDFYRRPAVFITPHSNSLHITRDTYRRGNHWFNVNHVNGICMVGIVWNSRTMTVYINDNRVESFAYDDECIPPDGDAKVFLCNRFLPWGGFFIQNLKFYDTALSRDMFLQHYRKEYLRT